MVKYLSCTLLLSFYLGAQTFTGGGLGLEIATEISKIDLQAQNFTKKYQKTLKRCGNTTKIKTFLDVAQFLMITEIEPSKIENKQCAPCNAYQEQKLIEKKTVCGHDKKSLKEFTSIIYQKSFTLFLRAKHNLNPEDAQKWTEELRRLYANTSVQE